MKVVIFYHEIQRELQNAYLLKAELIRRGHEVYIYHYDYIIKTKQVIAFEPDVVITHSFHDLRSMSCMSSIFKGKIKRLINLQYEQVIAPAWKDYHIPKEIERNAIHLCWGNSMRDLLLSKGIKKENVLVAGSLGVDMDRNKFKSIYKTKEELSVKYNLINCKKWILFISSFSMSELSMRRRRVFYSLIGKENTIQFCSISTKSKQTILKWIEDYIKENDCEFIYRPHPYEKRQYNNFQTLDDLNKKYDNFHVISEDSVRSWISACDKINTWLSTSIIDAYFMNKSCSILRPIEIPQCLEIEIMEKSRKIRQYKEFNNYNKYDDSNLFNLDKSAVEKYYQMDKDKYAYENICDLIELIVKENIVMNLYN